MRKYKAGERKFSLAVCYFHIHIETIENFLPPFTRLSTSFFPLLRAADTRYIIAAHKEWWGDRMRKTKGNFLSYRFFSLSMLLWEEEKKFEVYYKVYIVMDLLCCGEIFILLFNFWAPSFHFSELRLYLVAVN
jgi:hypothetical protein